MGPSSGSMILSGLATFCSPFNSQFGCLGPFGPTASTWFGSYHRKPGFFGCFFLLFGARKPGDTPRDPTPSRLGPLSTDQPVQVMTRTPCEARKPGKVLLGQARVTVPSPSTVREWIGKVPRGNRLHLPCTYHRVSWDSVVH